MNVGVLAPRTSWHYQDLKRAAKSLDVGLRVQTVDFSRLAARVDEGGQEQFYDSVASIDALDALIVRTMPVGSLQQIIFRMDMLHRMCAAGVKVINTPRSVEIAIDKYLSLSLMSSANIPVPTFAVCQSVEDGLEFYERLGGDVILKPVFGSMGKNIYRLTDAMVAKHQMTDFVERGEILYLQKFIHHGGRDIRILVIGDTVFGMRRENSSGAWLTNIAQGGTAVRYQPSTKEIELARHAARVNECRIAGVDLVYEQDFDVPLVLEVNASPGWQAIQDVCEQDVACEILRCVLNS